MKARAWSPRCRDTVLRRLQVFAVEDTSVQVCWGELAAGVHRVSAADARVDVVGDGGPGAVTLSGLPAGSRLELVVEAGDRVVARRPFATLAPPPGQLLCRLATINDIHIGATGFGAFMRMREDPVPAVPHPLRCATAAVREALAWGAQLLVVKGDLTEEGHQEHFDAIGRLLAGVPVPVDVVPGNHDVGARRTVAAQAALDAHGLRLVHGLQLRDLPGLRLLSLDTTIPGRAHGRVAHVQEEVCRLLSRARGGALVAMHHFPARYRFPTSWPPGIPGPEAERFLDAVAEAHPATFVTSGHTHRHRHRRHGPLHITEVGSTKDYPGTWTGYAVYEGGIMQVVRRVAAADCIRWSERTRRALGGLWGLISPGRLRDRCLSVTWPA